MGNENTPQRNGRVLDSLVNTYKNWVEQRSDYASTIDKRLQMLENTVPAMVVWNMYKENKCGKLDVEAFLAKQRTNRQSRKNQMARGSGGISCSKSQGASSLRENLSRHRPTSNKLTNEIECLRKLQHLMLQEKIIKMKIVELERIEALYMKEMAMKAIKDMKSTTEGDGKKASTNSEMCKTVTSTVSTGDGLGSNIQIEQNNSDVTNSEEEQYSCMLDVDRESILGPDGEFTFESHLKSCNCSDCECLACPTPSKEIEHIEPAVDKRAQDVFDGIAVEQQESEDTANASEAEEHKSASEVEKQESEKTAISNASVVEEQKSEETASSNASEVEKQESEKSAISNASVVEEQKSEETASSNASEVEKQESEKTGISNASGVEEKQSEETASASEVEETANVSDIEEQGSKETTNAIEIEEQQGDKIAITNANEVEGQESKQTANSSEVKDMDSVNVGVQEKTCEELSINVTATSVEVVVTEVESVAASNTSSVEVKSAKYMDANFVQEAVRVVEIVLSNEFPCFEGVVGEVVRGTDAVFISDILEAPVPEQAAALFESGIPDFTLVEETEVITDVEVIGMVDTHSDVGDGEGTEIAVDLPVPGEQGTVDEPAGESFHDDVENEKVVEDSIQKQFEREVEIIFDQGVKILESTASGDATRSEIAPCGNADFQMIARRLSLAVHNVEEFGGERANTVLQELKTAIETIRNAARVLVENEEDTVSIEMNVISINNSTNQSVELIELDVASIPVEIAAVVVEKSAVVDERESAPIEVTSGKLEDLGMTPVEFASITTEPCVQVENIFVQEPESVRCDAEVVFEAPTVAAVDVVCPAEVESDVTGTLVEVVKDIPAVFRTKGATCECVDVCLCDPCTGFTPYTPVLTQQILEHSGGISITGKSLDTTKDHCEDCDCDRCECNAICEEIHMHHIIPCGRAGIRVEGCKCPGEWHCECSPCTGQCDYGPKHCEICECSACECSPLCVEQQKAQQREATVPHQCAAVAARTAENASFGCPCIGVCACFPCFKKTGIAVHSKSCFCPLCRCNGSVPPGLGWKCAKTDVCTCEIQFCDCVGCTLHTDQIAANQNLLMAGEDTVFEEAVVSEDEQSDIDGRESQLEEAMKLNPINDVQVTEHEDVFLTVSTDQQDDDMTCGCGWSCHCADSNFLKRTGNSEEDMTCDCGSCHCSDCADPDFANRTGNPLKKMMCDCKSLCLCAVDLDPIDRASVIATEEFVCTCSDCAVAECLGNGRHAHHLASGSIRSDGGDTDVKGVVNVERAEFEGTNDFEQAVEIEGSGNATAGDISEHSSRNEQIASGMIPDILHITETELERFGQCTCSDCAVAECLGNRRQAHPLVTGSFKSYGGDTDVKGVVHVGGAEFEGTNDFEQAVEIEGSGNATAGDISEHSSRNEQIASGMIPDILHITETELERFGQCTCSDCAVAECLGNRRQALPLVTGSFKSYGGDTDVKGVVHVEGAEFEGTNDFEQAVEIEGSGNATAGDISEHSSRNEQIASGMIPDILHITETELERFGQCTCSDCAVAECLGTGRQAHPLVSGSFKSYGGDTDVKGVVNVERAEFERTNDFEQAVEIEGSGNATAGDISEKSSRNESIASDMIPDILNITEPELERLGQCTCSDCAVAECLGNRRQAHPLVSGSFKSYGGDTDVKGEVHVEGAEFEVTNDFEQAVEIEGSRNATAGDISEKSSRNESIASDMIPDILNITETELERFGQCTCSDCAVAECLGNRRQAHPLVSGSFKSYGGDTDNETRSVHSSARGTDEAVSTEIVMPDILCGNLFGEVSARSSEATPPGLAQSERMPDTPMMVVGHGIDCACELCADKLVPKIVHAANCHCSLCRQSSRKSSLTSTTEKRSEGGITREPSEKDSATRSVHSERVPSVAEKQSEEISTRESAERDSTTCSHSLHSKDMPSTSEKRNEEGTTGESAERDSVPGSLHSEGMATALEKRESYITGDVNDVQRSAIDGDGVEYGNLFDSATEGGRVDIGHDAFLQNKIVDNSSVKDEALKDNSVVRDVTVNIVNPDSSAVDYAICVESPMLVGAHDGDIPMNECSCAQCSCCKKCARKAETDSCTCPVCLCTGACTEKSARTLAAPKLVQNSTKDSCCIYDPGTTYTESTASVCSCVSSIMETNKEYVVEVEMEMGAKGIEIELLTCRCCDCLVCKCIPNVSTKSAVKPTAPTAEMLQAQCLNCECDCQACFEDKPGAVCLCSNCTCAKCTGDVPLPVYTEPSTSRYSSNCSCARCPCDEISPRPKPRHGLHCNCPECVCDELPAGTVTCKAFSKKCDAAYVELTPTQLVQVQQASAPVVDKGDCHTCTSVKCSLVRCDCPDCTSPHCPTNTTTERQPPSVPCDCPKCQNNTCPNLVIIFPENEITSEASLTSCDCAYCQNTACPYLPAKGSKSKTPTALQSANGNCPKKSATKVRCDCLQCVCGDCIYSFQSARDLPVTHKSNCDCVTCTCKSPPTSQHQVEPSGSAHCPCKICGDSCSCEHTVVWNTPTADCNCKRCKP